MCLHVLLWELTSKRSMLETVTDCTPTTIGTLTGRNATSFPVQQVHRTRKADNRDLLPGHRRTKTPICMNMNVNGLLPMSCHRTRHGHHYLGGATASLSYSGSRTSRCGHANIGTARLTFWGIEYMNRQLHRMSKDAVNLQYRRVMMLVRHSRRGVRKMSHKYQHADFTRPLSIGRQGTNRMLSTTNHQMPRCYLYIVPETHPGHRENEESTCWL